MSSRSCPRAYTSHERSCCTVKRVSLRSAGTTGIAGVAGVAAAPVFWGVVVAVVMVWFGDEAFPAFWGVRDERDDACGVVFDVATLPAFWGCVGERAVVDLGDAVRPRAFCVVWGLNGAEAADKFCGNLVTAALDATVDCARRENTVALASSIEVECA